MLNLDFENHYNLAIPLVTIKTPFRLERTILQGFANKDILMYFQPIRPMVIAR